MEKRRLRVTVALIPHRKRKTHFPHSDTTHLHRRAYSRQAQVRASCFCFQARALTLCRALDNREEFCRVARILLVLFMKSKEINLPSLIPSPPKKKKTTPKTKTRDTESRLAHIHTQRLGDARLGKRRGEEPAAERCEQRCHCYRWMFSFLRLYSNSR